LKKYDFGTKKERKIKKWKGMMMMGQEVKRGIYK